MPATKVFINYAWSSPEHKEWVLNFATALRQAGVDAMLDRWELKEGHESTAFMEKMVSDKSITKVVIVSDRVYAEKSDLRQGGAGIEAQIISKEIFDKADQDKFVVVVREKDPQGRPYLPTYYGSRIYIDFSDDALFLASFDQLLRWTENKPLNELPPLGELPAHLRAPDDAPALSTGLAKARAYDAISGVRGHAYLASKEYFERFAEELEKLRLDPEFDPAGDDFLANLRSFLPYRDECLQVIRAIARYTQAGRFGDLLHSFFEEFLKYTEAPEGMNSYRVRNFDNYKFFAYELFLHCCTVLLLENRPGLFNELVTTHYYLKRKADVGHDPLVPFTEFHQYMESLDTRNKVLGLNRTSLAADLINERTVTSGTPFRQLMQMDFLLFLRADLDHQGNFRRWWPVTLVYLGFDYRAFEIFERSRSKKYFEKLRPFLGDATKSHLEQLVSRYETPNDLTPPRFGWGFSLVPKALIGIDRLCTMP